MNPLTDAINGTLYNIDCTVYAPVQYLKKDAMHAVFIFSEKPIGKLPDLVYFVPKKSTKEGTSFNYKLSQEITAYHEEETDVTYYLVDGKAARPSDARQNFRVYVSFRLTAWIGEYREETTIRVKNIGAGGFFFISDKQYKIGTDLTVMFTQSKKPVLLTARIRSQRPVKDEGFHGYGCEFVDLTPIAESAVRSFVYKQEVLQAKQKKDLIDPDEDF